MKHNVRGNVKNSSYYLWSCKCQNKLSGPAGRKCNSWDIKKTDSLGLHQLLLIFVICNNRDYIQSITVPGDIRGFSCFASILRCRAYCRPAGCRSYLKDLHIQFNAAFLSEDYEDEEKKICSRVQGEKESIRDCLHVPCTCAKKK